MGVIQHSFDISDAVRNDCWILVELLFGGGRVETADLPLKRCQRSANVFAVGGENLTPTRGIVRRQARHLRLLAARSLGAVSVVSSGCIVANAVLANAIGDACGNRLAEASTALRSSGVMQS